MIYIKNIILCNETNEVVTQYNIACCVIFRCFYVLGESEDIIIRYNTYIVEYAFTFKFNDTALATLASNGTTLSVYAKHFS